MLRLKIICSKPSYNNNNLQSLADKVAAVLVSSPRPRQHVDHSALLWNGWLLFNILLLAGGFPYFDVAVVDAQGFSVLCHGYDGMGAVGGLVCQSLSDEYSSKILHALPVTPPTLHTLRSHSTELLANTLMVSTVVTRCTHCGHTQH